MSEFVSLRALDHVTTSPALYRFCIGSQCGLESNFNSATMHIRLSATSARNTLKILLAPTKEIQGRFHLRSAVVVDFCIQKCISEFGRRAFSVVGPIQWNAHTGERKEH